jgi:hypothetical protein
MMTFARAQERLRALEASAEPAPAAGRELAEALLRQALECLSGAPEYLLAARLLRTGGLRPDRESALDPSLRAISQAGLASWDPSTDELRPTPLLAALVGIFNSAIEALLAEAP